MTKSARTRREKLLGAAEGYTTLGMYEHALASLDEIADPEKAAFQIHLARGEALQHLHKYEAALESYDRALAENPEHVGLLLSMAWCYKRTDQLSRAIAATEQAYKIKPTDPLILYNLSCYWSLAGNKPQSLSWLGRALRMDKSLRKLIPEEHDFDSLRSDPDFQIIIKTEDDAHSAP